MKTNIKRIVWFSVIMVLAVLLYKPISYYVQTIKIYYKFQSSIQRTKDPIFLSDTKLQTYTPSEFDENGRLFYVCKVWGFLKYYLEFQTPRTQYIDSLLIRSIPQAIQAQETETFHAVIDNIIDSMRKYSSEGRTNPYPDVKDYTLLDNKWMYDTIFLNRDIQQKLDDIFCSHSGMKNLFVDSKTSGTIQFTNELTYPVFSDENLRLLGLFRYWNMINYFYVYKNYMDKSWDEVLYHAIPHFRIADTDTTYRQSVYRLTNELRDAHTSVPPYTYFAQSTYPDTRFPGMPRYCNSSQKIGAKNYFKGRIIVLVDEFTMSFGEYAAMAFQANPKIIIGNATAGADGNTVLYKFPGGVTTAFSALGIYYPDLSPTQRVGVSIDHVTEPTIEDIKNNIDTAYEKARYIAEKGAH